MPLQSLWTIATGSGDTSLSQQVFLVVFLAIVIGWIIIALWTRTLDNFTYNYLRMNDHSTWDTLLIAIAITLIFITIVWIVDTYQIVEGGLGREVVTEKDPLFAIAEGQRQSPIASAFTGSGAASIPTLFPSLVFR